MSSRFNFVPTPLAGVYRVEQQPVKDTRGFLSRVYCYDEFQEIGLFKPISQVNHTLTKEKGSVRGMHFQLPPHAESKIVSCVKGKILDVVVDIRKGSETFLSWHAEILEENDMASLVIGEGFAHGFQTLADNCELCYFHTAKYAADAEGGLNANDPRLNIDWPLAIEYISERDRLHPLLDENFEGIEIQ